MKRIKLALVGCGRISKNHFDTIEIYKDDIELKAICDNDQELLRDHEKRYKVNSYTNIDSMLDKEDLDLVALCTPSGIHAKQTILCANHGVNVLTEKPMATRWKDGIKMVNACDESNVRLFVVKQNRYNKTIELLKRAVEEDRFGKIHTVNINVYWTRPQEYYDQAKWRGTWEFDGGAFMNQASHYVDLLDWIVGPVEKIQAILSTTRNIEVEDSGVLNIKWRSGAIGS
ncbi:uncharacterized protein METZ01_LOCUS463576, partial [marine metagenome]